MDFSKEELGLILEALMIRIAIGACIKMEDAEKAQVLMNRFKDYTLARMGDK